MRYRTATLHKRKGGWKSWGLWFFCLFELPSVKSKRLDKQELSQLDCRVLALPFQTLVSSPLDTSFKSCQGLAATSFQGLAIHKSRVFYPDITTSLLSMSLPCSPGEGVLGGWTWGWQILHKVAAFPFLSVWEGPVLLSAVCLASNLVLCKKKIGIK